MSASPAQQYLDRVSIVAPQRWLLGGVAVLSAASAAVTTGIVAGNQNGIMLSLVVATAVVAAVRPDTHTALVAVVIVVWQWLAVSTDPVTPSVLVVTPLLYVFHVVIALMAVTPITAEVDRVVLGRWVRRSCWVAVAITAVWGLASIMQQRDAPGNAMLTFAGFATLGILMLIARSRGHSAGGES